MEKPSEKAGKVLIIDDDDLLRGYLSSLLEVRGYETFESPDAIHLVQLVRNITPDVVLLDYQLPGIDGISALKNLRKAHLTVPVIMITSSPNQQVAVQCLREGAQDFISKPIDDDFLCMVVERTLRYFGIDVANALFELLRYARHNEGCIQNEDSCSCGLKGKLENAVKSTQFPWERSER